MKNEQLKVVFGPMNGGNDKHPQPIIDICNLLGTPLPFNAICGKAPSEYIKENPLKGELESIKQVLGENMPEIEDEDLVKSFEDFKKKYKSQNNLKYTDVDLTVYFCDWLVFARDKGFTHNCYFDYELYNKELDVRDTFLNEGYRIRVHSACSKKKYRHYLLNKADFNKKFAKYVKRDWIDASTCTLEEFQQFVKKHEKFFGKPIKGTGGSGARVIERDNYSLDKLYEICCEEKLILEELIQQHPALAEFNESTLNTVRVTTLLCADGTPRILLTVARFGRKGKAVDNFHGGGVGAIVDIDSGMIISEAINREHERSPFHPDSGKAILGFQYPEWEKVKAAVCDAATMLPQMRNIGWDVAVTKDGDIEFVEGNGRPNYDVLQSPDQIGRKFRYEPYLAEIEEMQKAAVEKNVVKKNNSRTKIKKILKKIKRKVKRMVGRN